MTAAPEHVITLRPILDQPKDKGGLSNSRGTDDQMDLLRR